MGIGVGTLVSALVVPLLLRISLPAAWLALGGASLIAALLGERAASRLPATDTSIQDGEIARTGTAYTGIFAVTLVMAAYGLEAVGYIPHTVFWVDFLARQVGIGLHAASFQWGLFGVGAIAGPLLTGLWVSRVGWHKGLATGFLIQCLAVSLPLITVSPLGRSISSLAVGAMVPGIVSLTSGRLGELVGMAAHKRVWGRATFVFAVAQAVAGYALSGLYDVANSYRPLFAVAGCVLVIGLALVLASGLPKFGLHPTEAEETPCG